MSKYATRYRQKSRQFTTVEASTLWSHVLTTRSMSSWNSSRQKYVSTPDNM